MSARSLSFAKTQACGNDFLLVSEEELPLERSERGAALSKAMCDRLRGVGADGLIVYRGAVADFAMTLYNSDGSAAEISGNGLRCVGAYLVFRGLAGSEPFPVRTEAGLLTLELAGRAENAFSFRANLGRPRLERPFPAPLVSEGETFDVTVVSMGNPHAVLFTEAFDALELRRIGPRLESHPRFPQKTNVELVEVLSRSEIRMGIWERGAGETASSGTGSAAAAVASISNERVSSPVRVRCPGGTIDVEWGGPERDVFVTGEAVVVAEGTYFLGEERE